MNNKIVAGIKFGISLVAGIGIEIICSGFSNSVTANEKNPVKKMCVSVGSAVLGAMVGDMASNYISSEVDSVANLVTGVNKALNNEEDNSNE